MDGPRRAGQMLRAHPTEAVRFPSDAPARIRADSHLDVPKALEKHGEDGAGGSALAPDPVAASGHPYPVRAARPHHGARPRFIAQQPQDTP
ncbi:hypothetical protein AB0E77_10740 [Streptomyces sp. NPDC032940]|uniref:hypothetical protein n=1 Tax=Streptomyces sp. NPDC032940 TaxID=3155366 RepID=UPI003406E908